MKWCAYAPAPAAAAFLLRKHSRQNTGLPWVGLKGTVVSRPHCEQVVMVSVRGAPAGAPPWRLALHALQRLGSFLKFRSRKKCCSPAVKTNSAPQSEHLRLRSTISGITLAPTVPIQQNPLPGTAKRGLQPRPVLLHFPTILFPVSLTSQRLLGPLLFPRL